MSLLPVQLHHLHLSLCPSTSVWIPWILGYAWIFLGLSCQLCMNLEAGCSWLCFGVHGTGIDKGERNNPQIEPCQNQWVDMLIRAVCIFRVGSQGWALQWVDWAHYKNHRDETFPWQVLGLLPSWVMVISHRISQYTVWTGAWFFLCLLLAQIHDGSFCPIDHAKRFRRSLFGSSLLA